MTAAELRQQLIDEGAIRPANDDDDAALRPAGLDQPCLTLDAEGRAEAARAITEKPRQRAARAWRYS